MPGAKARSQDEVAPASGGFADTNASDEVDGRTARRDRNRLAVLDAAIELFIEDDLDPRPEDVARRSGVSLRSVYRYFSEPEELLRAAIDRHLERVMPLLRIHAIGEGPLDERIDELVGARVRLYEAIAPAARASRIAAARNEIIRAQVDLTRTTLRQQLELQFEPELSALDPDDRRAVANAADALCQVETLEYYRVHRRLSARETTSILQTALRRLFD